MPNDQREDSNDRIYGFQHPPANDTQGKFCFGIVGYADIIGFGDKMKDPERRESALRAYLEILTQIRAKEDWTYEHKTGIWEGFGYPAGQDYYTFIPTANHLYMISDSIFYILIPESSVKFESGPSGLDVALFGFSAVRVMAKILTICWNYGLPARGAISDGEIYYNSKERVFLGEPLVKAFRWEAVQSFAWFTIDPTSAISREGKKRPSHLISKVTKPLEGCDNFFKERKLTKFREEWPFSELSPLTSLPEHLNSVGNETEPKNASSNGVTISFSDLLDRNIRNAEPDHADLWKNTKELFRSIGAL